MTNWKKHLLRTSVPLEHEATQVLARADYIVSADYPYQRWESGAEKEFSVDIRGLKGRDRPGRIFWGCHFDVLVECKYRDRGTTWLFLPQPRDVWMEIGYAIKGVDLFSPRFVHGRISFKKSEKAHYCYSAVEVGSIDRTSDGSDKGRAFDAQLRHGVRQLQYALPALVASRARESIVERLENYPFFFIPILLTNARLIVTAHDFNVAAVDKAESLEDLGVEVSWLIWSSALGPDFHSHCVRHLGPLSSLADTKQFKELEKRRKRLGITEKLQPSFVLSRLAIDGSGAKDVAEFTKVLVVNVNALPQIVAIIDQAFIELADAVNEKPVHR